LSFNAAGWLSVISAYCLMCFSCSRHDRSIDVLVIGGGTGAVSAAIQSARSGSETILVHPFPWLGGMLTAAGVSATDGNHHLPAGLWGEFRQMLRDHYGGADSLFTGWVSNTMFEPHVGAQIWETLATRESRLTILKESAWKLLDTGPGWLDEVTLPGGEKRVVRASVLVDGTDLGDVAAMTGIPYDLGMDARSECGEPEAPPEGNRIVQDITYVAILKDFGPGADMTIPKPPGYSANEFSCTCKHSGCDSEDALDCGQMMLYGKLPGGKYMINWPRNGNDYGVNMVESGPEAREEATRAAKAKTLRYVYYLQDELGLRNLGLADDEFPTEDKLPFYPYHREGRRIRGVVRMKLGNITDPYQGYLYRTGIAVGDYPIDHHHDEVPQAPEIHFPAVPSYSVPMGSLIPDKADGFLVADKTISVTNIVNGTTRLQPVVIQVGQAAGLMAAMAAQLGRNPGELDVREVQQQVLDYGGYLMPYFDVQPDDPHFQSIQKAGATGVLRGKGVPYQWANRTMFYPDSAFSGGLFLGQYDDSLKELVVRQDNPAWTVVDGLTLVHATRKKLVPADTQVHYRDFEARMEAEWENDLQLHNFQKDRPITRREMAVLLDKVCNLFHHKNVDLHGHWK
jgi:hypothetical protein